MASENQETKICKHCKSEIAKDAKVCPHCRKRQSGVGKWIVIAVAALVVIAALSSGSSDSSSKSTSATKQVSSNNSTNVVSNENVSETKTTKSSSTGSSSKSADSEQYKVGSTIDKNGLKITINDADLNFTAYDNPYGWYTPSNGMKYIKISFTFENTSNSDKYVSIYDFDCYADNETCQQKYGLNDDDFINTNLSTGRSKSFSTFYEVPVSASSIELEYETSWWTGKKAVIKLQ
jgi:RNA polymerase subunit RPABC4/transcription elongation factor Spt4